MRACFDLILFWVSFVVTIHSNLDSGEVDNLGALYCGIGCIFIIFIIVINNRNLVLSKLSFNIFLTDNEADIIRYFYRMVPFIEKCDSREIRIELYGILKSLFESAVKAESSLIPQITELLVFKYTKADEFRLKCYTLLYEILVDLNKNKFQKGDYIRLLVAYICHTKLNLKWIAFDNLHRITDKNRRMGLVVASFSFLVVIEKSMKE